MPRGKPTYVRRDPVLRWKTGMSRSSPSSLYANPPTTHEVQFVRNWASITHHEISQVLENVSSTSLRQWREFRIDLTSIRNYCFEDIFNPRWNLTSMELLFFESVLLLLFPWFVIMRLVSPLIGFSVPFWSRFQVSDTVLPVRFTRKKKKKNVPSDRQSANFTFTTLYK